MRFFIINPEFLNNVVEKPFKLNIYFLIEKLD